jgi:hypothetical protein
VCAHCGACIAALPSDGFPPLTNHETLSTRCSPAPTLTRNTRPASRARIRLSSPAGLAWRMLLALTWGSSLPATMAQSNISPQRSCGGWQRSRGWRCRARCQGRTRWVEGEGASRAGRSGWAGGGWVRAGRGSGVGGWVGGWVGGILCMLHTTMRRWRCSWACRHDRTWCVGHGWAWRGSASGMCLALALHQPPIHRCREQTAAAAELPFPLPLPTRPPACLPSHPACSGRSTRTPLSSCGATF